MNKIVGIIFLISTLLGCDTSSNVTPMGDAYFLKFYGSLGDQEGVTVKSTPDGGFIIGGNSTPEFEGQSDYLLVKVDGFGNQEWQETYDINGIGENDFITDLIIDGNEFVIAGTSVINGVDKATLLRVGMDGVVVGAPVILDEFSDIAVKLNGISVTSSGDFLITGPITDGDAAQYGKSVLAVVNKQFSVVDSIFYPTTASLVGEETTFVKVLEVNNSNTNELDYLAFAYINSSGGPELTVVQLNSKLDPPSLDPTSRSFNNSKIIDVIKISDREYKVLSASDNSTYLINVEETGAGYVLGADQSVKYDDFSQGVSLAFKSDNQFLISANSRVENSDITASSIIESSTAGIINWKRYFGTEISYTSGKVITLNDGSVVYTGTAGFKGQKKAFLIKLKSNGEMKE